MSGYTGWELTEQDRTRLLAVFPPRYPDLIAHHITAEFGVKDDHPLPERLGVLVVAEVFDDALGVQALVCEIAGTTTRRDGKTFHVTWSLDRERGAAAKQSNDVIQSGFARARTLYYIDPEPRFFAS